MDLLKLFKTNNRLSKYSYIFSKKEKNEPDLDLKVF